MFAVIRLAGKADINKGTIDTLKMLRIDYPNNCVLVPETSDFKGMLQRVKDYVTFGEIDKKVLVELLKKRLKNNDNRAMDAKSLKDVLGVSSLDELADALMTGKIKLNRLTRPFFRLTPPSKGFKDVTAQYPKGDLGYRGNAINPLIEKMI